ncbi:MAG: hypothetical protein JW986_04745 [Methanotrichaceae archaeon]|nr:hypothetical protein [Methanotrichaceae archaeon]
MDEGDTHWTTGRRDIVNTSLTIEGLSYGDGNFSRYTEMGFAEVGLKERISAVRGTLDTRESVSIKAVDDADPVAIIQKRSGNQDYYVAVNETWPVSISAERVIDYTGPGINEREVLFNNYDWVSSSYLYNTDLRMDRSCNMRLNDTWFLFAMNNTTKTILRDWFWPNKTMEYRLESQSEGLATLALSISKDRRRIFERTDDYAGNYQLSRRLNVEGKGNDTTEEEPWLECCPGALTPIKGSLWTCIFEV